MQQAADEAVPIDWDGDPLDAAHVEAHGSASKAREKAPAPEKRTVNDAWLGPLSRRRHRKNTPLSRWDTVFSLSIESVLDAISRSRFPPWIPRERLACLHIERPYGARHYQQ